MQVDNLEATIMSDERTDNKRREHLRGRRKKHEVYFTRREGGRRFDSRNTGEKEGEITKSSATDARTHKY